MSARSSESRIAGVMLTLLLGGGALALVRVLPQRPFISSVLIALMMGSLVVNLPTGHWLRIRYDDPANNPFMPGLNFVGKPLLRAAVVLMGLRIEAHDFGAGQLLTIGLTLAAAIPATFFLTHALAVPLRVPRPLADLVSAGTMICGASAVNAVAPVIGARREDQALALGTVFLFSAVALVAFRPLAVAVGLAPHDAGVWGGLAVNDLASAVAVGAQMGPGGAEMAAASKSLRILMLAPILIAFGVARRPEARAGELRRAAAKHVPGFVVGFMVLVAARAAVDHVAGDLAAWRAILAADKFAVELAMAMVAASIGLNLRVDGLLGAGCRAVVLGAVAASAMAGLSLTLVFLGARGLYVAVFATAALAVAVTFTAFRVARHAEAVADRDQRRRYRAVRTMSGHVRLAPVTGEYRIP
ncbi:MAG TPA: putative sulfate exporter family transporter [Polyangia bacterium]|nr:putative sulfate exporter family transporter [Polyangia bacterium]